MRPIMKIVMLTRKDIEKTKPQVKMFQNEKSTKVTVFKTISTVIVIKNKAFLQEENTVITQYLSEESQKNTLKTAL